MAKQETALLVPQYAVMQHTPEHLQEVIQSNLGGGSLGPGDLEKITVPAGGGTTWSIPSLDGDLDTKEFDGVIAGFRDQRAYWPGAYSGGSEPPDCSSDDAITGVGNPGGDCASCQFAQSGSAIGEDGSKRPGQACKKIRLMAIIQKDDLVPVLLAAPPTSHQNMRRYFLKLASRATPYYGVVTRFTLKKAQSQGGITYSQIEASAIERLGEEELAKMQGYVSVIGHSLDRRAVANPEDF